MFRLALVVGLLLAFPADGFSQSRREKRQSRWMNPILQKAAEDSAGKLAGEAVRKAFAEKPLFPDMMEKVSLADLEASERLYVQLRLDPTVRKKLEKETPTNELIDREKLLSRGSVSHFLAETTKFAEKMKADKYSDPVLGMMYFDVENDAIFRICDLKPGTLTSHLTFKGDAPSGDRTASAVPSFWSVRAKSAKQVHPLAVHCSFVFVAMKDDTGSTKTLNFDLYLEDFKISTESYLPWKVKNVEYK